MAIKWQERTDYWLGVTKAPYPRFEAWQSDDVADNCWCLKIIRGADLEPVEIREIHGAGALAEFAEGFLEERLSSNLYSGGARPSMHLARAEVS